MKAVLYKNNQRTAPVGATWWDCLVFERGASNWENIYKQIPDFVKGNNREVMIFELGDVLQSFVPKVIINPDTELRND
jgi:hypothetical protein